MTGVKDPTCQKALQYGFLNATGAFHGWGRDSFDSTNQSEYANILHTRHLQADRGVAEVAAQLSSVESAVKLSMPNVLAICNLEDWKSSNHQHPVNTMSIYLDALVGGRNQKALFVPLITIMQHEVFEQITVNVSYRKFFGFGRLVQRSEESFLYRMTYGAGEISYDSLSPFLREEGSEEGLTVRKIFRRLMSETEYPLGLLKVHDDFKSFWSDAQRKKDLEVRGAPAYVLCAIAASKNLTYSGY